MKDPNANMSGYNETKAGLIPHDWDAVRLDTVATRATGHTPDKDFPAYWNGGIGWVSLADSWQLDKPQISETEKTITPDGIANSSARLLPRGTVILLRDASVGKVSILSREMAVSQHFVAWVCGNRLDNRFLYYLLLSKRRLFERIAVGTTIVTIGMEFFEKLMVPIPPLREQRSNAGSEQVARLIAAKKTQKRALMQQLLTGKKRLPGFSGSFKRCKIGALFKEVSRPVDWDDCTAYSLLSVRRRSGGVFLRERLRGDQIATKVMFVAHAGDFLISKMQVLHGATGLVPRHLDGCHISGSYIALRPTANDVVCPEFFARLSEMHEFLHLTYLCSYGVHIEKMTFNLEWFLESHVLMPASFEEQEAIALVLGTADHEIALLERKHGALCQQKRGLMQKLLSGQIRVKP